MFACKLRCRILLVIIVFVTQNVFISFAENRTASTTYERLWTTSDSDTINRTSRSLTNATCPDHMFQCRDGQCIFQNRTCNHVADCTDLSDEDDTMCARRKPCVGPNSIKNGSVSLSSSLTFDKYGNQLVYRSYHFKCNKNYGLFPVYRSVGCFEKKWTSEFPQCLPTCPSRTSALVETYCEKNGTKLDCAEPLVEGATVSMKCKPRYDEDNPLNRPAVECDTECGQVAPQGKLLIANGTQTKVGEFPWHVGIYKQPAENSKYDYQCGGSIINPKTVLTAAHCFTEENGTLFNVEEYFIAAGKYYRNYESPLDSFVQKREVEMINIPAYYNGFVTSYSADIALAIVKKSFELSNAVRPICVDWNNDFEREQLQSGNFGKVAGWGYTSKGRNLAEELEQLTVPYVERDTCVKVVPEYFIRFLTPDKFCAGYQNGSSICNGDSGSGLVFYREEDKKYYIRGLVSAVPLNSGTCDSHQYGTFTKISQYIEFIKPIMEEHSGKCRRLINETDNKPTVAVCSNGTWDALLITCVPECGQTAPQGTLLVLGDSPIKKNNFPWHVGIYRKDPKRFRYDYLCGGSIISHRVVITYLYCFYDNNKFEWNANNTYVAAGKYYKEYDSPRDVLAQQRKIIHLEYNKEKHMDYLDTKDLSMSWTVALVVTEEPFTLNNFVRPVCIDWDNNMDNKDMSLGTLTDWDLKFNEKEEVTNELKQVTVPFFSLDGCAQISGNRTDIICTNYLNETRICRTSNGIGLVSYNKESKKYYLKGILTASLQKQGCITKEHITYLSIAAYLEYIRSVELKYRI